MKYVGGCLVDCATVLFGVSTGENFPLEWSSGFAVLCWFRVGVVLDWQQQHHLPRTPQRRQLELKTVR